MSTVDLSEAGDRRALATFLKAMRARLKPADLGLPASPRRRAAGLLREEVAQAAGMSATWYGWMEQGRPVNPSAQVLNGIARALRLDDAERAYLFRVARPDLQDSPPEAPSCSLAPPLQALLRGLAPHPAYAMNAFGDVMAWNPPAERLLGSFDSAETLRRNVFGRLFLDPDWRALFVNWEEIVRSAVGQLRATTAGLQGDAHFAAFLAALQDASPAFAGLWQEQRVQALPRFRKTLDHPEAGRLVFDYATLRPDAAPPDVRFTVYTPAEARTAERFAACLAA